MNVVFGSWWAKLGTVVDKYKGLILGLQVNMNDHIRPMVTGDVAEFKSDGGEVTTLTKDVVGNHIALCARGIASRKLNNDSLTIQIDGYEVGGMLRAITVTDNSVDLEGTRVAITDVIIACEAPGED